MLAFFSPPTRGVIPEVTHNTDKKSTFPRPCGGDPVVDVPGVAAKDFSPPTRG